MASAELWALLAPEAAGVGARHLLLPSRQRPRWVIPCDSALVAARGLAMYAPATAVGRLYKAAMSALLRCGFKGFPWQTLWLAPDRPSSLIGQLQPIFPGNSLIGRVAVAAGTAGGRQKATLQIMSPAGAVLAYGKVGQAPPVNAALAHEVDVLKALADSPVAHCVPTVLAVLRADEQVLVALSAGGGVHPGTALALPQVDFLRRLLLDDEISIWRHAAEDLSLPNRFCALTGRLSASLAGVLGQAMRHLANSPSCCRAALVHGDFAPWNMRAQAGSPRPLFVYDWEFGRLRGLAGWDLIHFIAQTALLVTGASPLELNARLRGLMHDRLCTQYLQVAQVDKRCLDDLIVLYLTDSLISGLEIEGLNGAPEAWRRQAALAALLAPGAQVFDAVGQSQTTGV